MVFDIPNACSKSASPNQAELPPQDSYTKVLGNSDYSSTKIPSVKENSP
jgi:hypothetical protein